MAGTSSLVIDWCADHRIEVVYPPGNASWLNREWTATSGPVPTFAGTVITVPILSRTHRVGITCVAGLVMLAATACGGGGNGGGGGASPVRPSSTAAKASTTASAGPADALARQWIDKFCAQSTDSEQELASLRDAAIDYGDRLSVSNVPTVKQDLYGVVHLLDIGMSGNASTLAATRTTTPSDARARTFLLGVYSELHAGLGDDQATINALPTTDVSQFNAQMASAAQDALGTVMANVVKIKADPTLGPVYTANSACG